MYMYKYIACNLNVLDYAQLLCLNCYVKNSYTGTNVLGIGSTVPNTVSSDHNVENVLANLIMLRYSIELCLYRLYVTPSIVLMYNLINITDSREVNFMMIRLLLPVSSH